MKVSEIIRKTSLVAFLLKNLSFPIYPPVTISRQTPPQVFPLYAPRIFEIAVTASVIQSLFSEVTETSGFCDSVKKSNTCMVCSEKSSSRNFEKSPFNRICRLTV